MDMVIMWHRTYIPHSVFEGIKSFTEASTLVDEAMVECGTAKSINLFEDHKWIASLRTVR